MRKLYAALAAALLAIGPASADESTDKSALTALMTAYDARGWEGVGRINIGRGGMCTGALISSRIVLTAAHCLFDPVTHRQVDVSQIKFLAGWRNERATAYRNVRQAIAHPKYVFQGREGALRVAHDVAVLELDSEIRLSNVQPFETASKPIKGAKVGVVSYAHDRQNTPSIQEVCHVLARQKGALVLSCDVDFGSSGAPIFAEVNGEPKIVSVVSAKATVKGRPVSLGTSLETELEDLLAMLGTRDPVFARPTVSRGAGASRITASGGDGAKFLKP